MPVIICMLRGVNLGGRNMIRMEELKGLCLGLKLKNVETFIQSGNVIFSSEEKDLEKLCKRIQDAIEKKVGFRPAVILRTAAELRKVIQKNPFAKRDGIDPSNYLVTFLAAAPGKEQIQKTLAIPTGPEELRIIGREVFIYFINGQGRSDLSWSKVERALGTSGTGRNWNSVTKMMAIAERLEALG